jgi:hypothetical protein
VWSIPSNESDIKPKRKYSARAEKALPTEEGYHEDCPLGRRADGAAIVEEPDEAIRSVVRMILGRELGECGLFSIVQRGEPRRRGRTLKILGKALSV